MTFLTSWTWIWGFVWVRKSFWDRRYKWVFRGTSFSHSSRHLRSFGKIKILEDFLKLIQYFFLNYKLLEIDFRHKILENMHFWGRYDFSKLCLLRMLEFVHLIRFILLKIFLSTIQPRISFLCDIDILKYVCDFFYDFIWSFIIF